MARIAYVDHSYHRSTQSTSFLVEILERRGHSVDRFWDDSWRDGAPVAWAEVSAYDVVIFFQSFCKVEERHFRLAHPCVIYIPMLDQFAMWRGPLMNLASFWEVFQGSKVLNFSNALHCMTLGFGIASHFVRYYPPVPSIASTSKEGLHGFFWLRNETQVSWKTVRQLMGDAKFDSFHLHLGLDPGAPEPELPSPEEVTRHRITMSRWFEDKADLDAIVERANVFFAPRLGEGIGQSFLEAMGRGQCVVAPDEGTMNEYILSDVNGLLYEFDDLKPINFSNRALLGARARDSAIKGRAAWQAREDALVQFILRPSEEAYACKYRHPSVYDALEKKTGLRAVAQHYTWLRKSRPIWYPLVRMVRRIAGR